MQSPARARAKTLFAIHKGKYSDEIENEICRLYRSEIFFNRFFLFFDSFSALNYDENMNGRYKNGTRLPPPSQTNMIETRHLCRGTYVFGQVGHSSREPFGVWL